MQLTSTLFVEFVVFWCFGCLSKLALWTFGQFRCQSLADKLGVRLIMTDLGSLFAHRYIAWKEYIWRSKYFQSRPLVQAF